MNYLPTPDQLIGNSVSEAEFKENLKRTIEFIAELKPYIDSLVINANEGALNNILQDAIDAAAAAGAGANGWTDLLIKTQDGSTQRDINERSLKNGDYAPVLGSPVRLKLNPIKASFLYGISDPEHLDDNLNNFRGLNSQNAWDDSNINVGSVAFGRNNVPFAYLSTALGHDCVAYGVASLTGGAGSATGNPDVPLDGASYGYCSFAWGKDTVALGRISAALGQECKALSIYSHSSGMQSISGAGLATHSNTLTDESGNPLPGVVSDGRGAFTHGYRCYAYGDDSIAFGSSVTAHNGAQVFGSGINPGSPLVNSLPNSIAFGRNVDVPTVIIEGTQGYGVNGAFGKVGINTEIAKERVEIVVNNQDKVAIRSKNGGAALDLQGTLSNGGSASIFRIEYTSPNGGQAYGKTDVYQNNQNWLSLNESGDPIFKKVVDSLYGYRVNGTKVIGGQVGAIANSDGSSSDNTRALNAILAALRIHGLIET